MSKSTVMLRSVENASVESVVRDVFETLDTSWLTADTRVAVKVNLSTPFSDNALGSNTDPQILDAVCKVLSEHTKHIIVGESNGMRYSTHDAFKVMGYDTILAKYGLKPFSFSDDEWVETEHKLIKGWGLSKQLLAADAFITLPVLKTHATTVFTGSLKNQFGCYPQHNRILLHPKLDDVLVLINQILKPKLAIMDGIVGMEGRGPINGEPRRMDLVLASNDPVALDSTAMRLVGLDPYTSGHIRKAGERGVGEIKFENINIDGDFEQHKCEFLPAAKDLPIKLLGVISHSKFLTEKLILNPGAFYPLRSAAIKFRGVRDFVLRKDRES
jgi:uncharacterized protein (DUF362 family)